MKEDRYWSVEALELARAATQRKEEFGTGRASFTSRKGCRVGLPATFALHTNDASSGNLWGEDWTPQFTFVDRGGNEMKTLQFPLKCDGSGPIKPFPPDLEKNLNQRLGTIDVEFVGH